MFKATLSTALLSFRRKPESSLIAGSRLKPQPTKSRRI